MTPDEATELRRAMVRDQLVPRGISDAAVLQAMSKVPRERFIMEQIAHRAYEDAAMALPHRQTISQPYICAAILQGLRLTGNERVLEVGTGSGYLTALLCELAREVWTIERIQELSDSARARIEEQGYRNVRFFVGDGSVGLPEGAPYDAIAVSAAAPSVPPRLLAQLAPGGRLVIPVGDLIQQELMSVVKVGQTFERRALTPCAFVPLLGEDSWQKRDDR